jgi:peroxiredoxin
MKKFIYTILILCLVNTLANAQKALDFTVKDINNKDHSLYADYLNNGKIIVTYLMLTDCPPCHTLAPRFQRIYEKFGSGKGNVEFLILSISPSDTLESLQNFQETHQITSPIIGPEGGSLTASIQFTNARYGPYQYVPQFSIIFPNGDVVYGIVASRLEERIADALSARTTMPNKINIEYTIPFTSNDVNPLKSTFHLRSYQDLNYNRNIIVANNGTISFDYPSTQYPEVDEPYISFESTESTPRGMVNISDVIALRKHVLRLEDLTEDAIIAADINNDGRITLSDIVEMQRFILGIDREWKNRPAIIMHPSTIPFEVKGSAQTITLEPKLIWVGNLVEE